MQKEDRCISLVILLFILLIVCYRIDNNRIKNTPDSSMNTDITTITNYNLNKTTTTTTTTKSKFKLTTNYTTYIITSAENITETTQSDITTEEIKTENSEYTSEEIINIEPEQTEEYVIYKPSTHYIHRSSCHWNNGDQVVIITDTNGIVARRCTECNPDMEIINEYVEPENTTISNAPNPVIALIDSDKEYLAEIVQHEAGSNWIGIYEKAMVVAGIMNRVNDSRFPNSVYDVLTQPNQFPSFYIGSYSPSQECYDAVDYYFNHYEEFGNYNSWYGDGTSNHFYYQ